jgi:hypothetical protein
MRPSSLQLALVATVLAPTATARAADPSPDAAQQCIAGSERGQSERDEGKYRDARESFLQCARDVCPPVVLKMCTGWLREIDQMAPTVVFGARDEKGNDVADVTVSFDGMQIASRLDGRPIEVDSGEHVLRFERKHSVPVEERLILRTGEKARLVKVTLKSDTPVEATPTPDVVAPTPGVPPVMWPRNVTAGAFAALALGAVGTGVGFILSSNRDEENATTLRSRIGQSTSACVNVSSSNCTNLSNTVQAQHTDANTATALFIGGGALAVAALATWLLWPTSRESRGTQPQTSGWIAPVPGGAMLAVVGNLP